MSLKMDDLKAVYDEYSTDPAFDHLRNAELSRNFVPGAGYIDAKVMLIGEAPGKMENAKGIPFVGRAGVYLKDLLDDVGINDEDVFHTNTVKYWPLKQEDGTYTPTEKEIVDSRDYLIREINIIEPLVVGLCGLTAVRALFPSIPSVREKHGELLDGKFVPLYHPALVGYQPYSKNKVRTGYIKLRAYLDAKEDFFVK